jgi:tetratricopeptide (TPR) repeat protein
MAGQTGSRTLEVDSEPFADRVEEVDDEFVNHLEIDGRLQSGAADDASAGDLAFIQMTGLAPPADEDNTVIALGPPPPPSPSATPEIPPPDPVSFYEKGVEDVDEGMSPVGLADPREPQPEGPPRANGESLESVKKLMADLADDAPPPASEEENDGLPDIRLMDSEDEVEEEALPEAPPEPVVEPEPTMEAIEEEEEPSAPVPLGQPVAAAPAPIEAPVVEELPPEPDFFDPAEDDAKFDVESRFVDRRAVRYRSGARKTKRQIRRYAMRTASALVIGAIVYQGAVWVAAGLSGPESQLAAARKLAAAGEHRSAAGAFVTFAARNPQHPARGDALFGAALALQQVDSLSADRGQVVYEQARGLYEQFLEEYPSHAKAARAANLLGALHYQHGHHAEAVEILRDPDLRLRDPYGALSALRTLARSYAQLGEFDRARSAFLQAASMSINYTPDMDYNELGDLYKFQAGQTTDLHDERRLNALAVEHWTQAMRFSGIDRQDKQHIRMKRDALRAQMGELESGLTETE